MAERQHMPGLGPKAAMDAPSAVAQMQAIASSTSPIIREGWLTKEGRVVKSWKRRYFVLRGGRLIYYQSNSKDIATLKGQMPLGGCTVRRGNVGSAEDVSSSFSSLPPSAAASGPSSAALSGANSGSSLQQQQLAAIEEDVSAFRFHFSIEGAGRLLNMAAASEDDMKQWMQACVNAINVENYIADCKAFEVEPIANLSMIVGDHTQQKLVLEDESLTLDSTRTIAEVLRRNLPVRSVSLHRCGLADAFMAPLVHGLSHNNIVNYISLSENRIADSGTNDLTQGLFINVSVHTLILSRNCIGDVGAAHLSDLLRANTTLIKLDLAHNRIGAKGASALAKALAANSSLEELILDGNYLGDEGAAALAETLVECKNLKKLGIAGNGIGSQGIVVLAGEGLSRNKSITDLDLSANVFGKEGALALVDALKESRSISRVNVGQNSHLGTEGIAALAEVLKSRFSVAKLVMLRTTKPAALGGSVAAQ